MLVTRSLDTNVQQTKTFLPNSMESWLVVVGILATWIGSGWTLWNKLTTKVNGLGGRVKRVEEECKERDGRVGRLETEITEYRRDREVSSKEIGELKAMVQNTNQHVVELQLEVGAHMSDLKNLINEKDANTRERLASLETVIRRDVR